MMKVILSKKFEKQFKKLRVNEKKRVLESLEKFKNDPFQKSLNNHVLNGKKLLGLRSISAGGDIRLLFEEEDEYLVVVFVTLGSHSSLY